MKFAKWWSRNGGLIGITLMIILIPLNIMCWVFLGDMLLDDGEGDD